MTILEITSKEAEAVCSADPLPVFLNNVNRWGACCSVAVAGLGMSRPWIPALFPSDYLGTDWQFFQRDVREAL